jgi:hypothetical protein
MQAIPQSQHRRWWTPLRKVLAGMGGAIGLVAALVTFVPHVLIVPDVPPDQVSGSLGTFQIENVGIVGLSDVQTYIGICSGNNPHYQCKGSLQSRLHFLRWDHPWVGPDDRYSIDLKDFWRMPGFKWMDMSLIVSYRPWFLPWRREFEVRFITDFQPDGKVVWAARPSSE